MSLAHPSVSSEVIRCPLCGSAGTVLEKDVSDYYFGAPGHWDYYRCGAAECAVAFPSPEIPDAVLASAYGQYYTHDEPAYSPLMRLRDAAMRLVLPGKARGGRSWLDRIPFVDWLAEQEAWSLGGYRGADGGSILDVGCGSGSRLDRLKAVGWSEAVGVEFDAQAVTAARAQGRDVRQGSAEALAEEDAAFDGVIMHHVIEHVRDPQAAFTEAGRVLKPGGTLFVVTPNIDSALRQEVGRRWRGFEAPRHLMLFTVQALAGMAHLAGFEVIVCKASARSAAWMRAVSTDKKTTGGIAQRLAAYGLYRSQKKLIEQGFPVGDELVLIAQKPLSPG